MPTQTGEYGVTFPDGTLQTTAAFGNGTATVFTFNSSATWTRPSSGAMTRIQLWGGGGSAGNTGGGGGGGYNEFSLPTTQLGATVNLTVGAGGTGTTSYYGNTGGLTLFPIAVVDASIAGTTLSVSNIQSGVLYKGMIVTGTGISSGTYITAFGTASGGIGTYILSSSQGSLSTRTVTINLSAGGGGAGGTGPYEGGGNGGGQWGVNSPGIGEGSGAWENNAGEPPYPSSAGGSGFWTGGGGGTTIQFTGGGNAGNSIYGGAGGGGYNASPGVSLYAGNGGNGIDSGYGNGSPGYAPGGGGGAANFGTGGSGGNGRIVITVA